MNNTRNNLLAILCIFITQACFSETVKVFGLKFPLETIKDSYVIKNSAYFRDHYIHSNGKFYTTETVGTRYNYSYGLFNESNPNPHFVDAIKSILMRYKKKDIEGPAQIYNKVITFYDKNDNLLAVVNSGFYPNHAYAFSRLDKTIKRVGVKAKIFKCFNRGKVIAFYDLKGYQITPSTRYNGDKNLSPKFIKDTEKEYNIDLSKAKLIIEDKTQTLF